VSAVRTLTVAPEDAQLRLDRWFRREFPALGHGRLEKLLRTGQVRVDGRRVKASTRLVPGQAIRVPPLDIAGAKPAPRLPARISAEDAEALQSAVLYRDGSVIALNKPAGLAVQGGSGQRRHLDAMLDALRFGAAERPRLVHRLDRDTSGVLLLARSAAAARALAAAFRGKEVGKVYWALVSGVPARRRGRIALPLAKRPGPGGEKVAADEDSGKDAVTLYRVVQTQGDKAAWLALMPLTGRTHQLRAHCALMGTPILGDGKYGGKAAFPKDMELPGRLMLLARELGLPHPDDGTTLRVTAPLPPHMAEAWKILGFDETRGESAAHDLLAHAEGLKHSPG
jgi:23S rRNA pseudouridine955/2504/2580 synthase